MVNDYAYAVFMLLFKPRYEFLPKFINTKLQLSQHTDSELPGTSDP